MKTKILIVEDTFSIQDRGLVICGLKTGEFVDFKIGDSVEIQTSEEIFLQTKVKGIQPIARTPHRGELICFLTDKKIEKSDVPKSAAIWLLNNND